MEFFENQKEPSTCRLHAINNALGYAAINWNQFLAYCKEFDKKYDTCGSADFFIVADSGDTIINFILSKLGKKSIYYPIGSFGSQKDFLRENDEKKSVAIIGFGEKTSHAWAARKIGESKWMKFDSLKPKATPLDPHIFNKRNGFIAILN